MKEGYMIKYKCEYCEKTFIAFKDRHVLYICPCEESYVDLEEEYSRLCGNLYYISTFKAPWFKVEDDYHSALLSWLNDSDELYTLMKEKNILSIVRLK